MNFDEIMKELIRLNFSRRSKQIKMSLDHYQYNIEMCTIQVNPGRRIGKTEWIRNHATCNDLVILSNLSCVNDFLSKYHFSSLTPLVTTFNSFYNGYRFYNKDFVNIYVDDYNFISRHIDIHAHILPYDRSHLEHTFFFIG